MYETGPLGRLGGPPEAVAKRIAKALAAARPRARYTVTPSARALIAQRALLPDAAWDAAMRTQFPSARPRLIRHRSTRGRRRGTRPPAR